MTDTTKDLGERTSYLGASEVAAVLGLSPWATPYQIWARKTGRLSEPPCNDAMDAGIRLEPVVLDWARTQLGDIAPGCACPIPHSPIIAHPDGITITGRPVEAKTAGIVAPLRGHWGPAGTDEVPDMYLVQLLVQMAALNCNEGHIVALLGGMGFRMYNIKDEKNLRSEIVERASLWWDKFVLHDVPPVVQPGDLHALRNLRRIPERVSIDTQLVTDWLDAKEKVYQAQRLLEEKESQLLAALADAEEGECKTGIISCKLVHRKEYTVKASSYRVLRYKAFSDVLDQ